MTADVTPGRVEQSGESPLLSKFKSLTVKAVRQERRVDLADSVAHTAEGNFDVDGIGCSPEELRSTLNQFVTEISAGKLSLSGLEFEIGETWRKPNYDESEGGSRTRRWEWKAESKRFSFGMEFINEIQGEEAGRLTNLNYYVLGLETNIGQKVVNLFSSFANLIK